VDPKTFHGFEYAATQAIAAAAFFLEFDALIVPSARYSGANLVAFLDRLATSPDLLESADVDWSAWRATNRR
jgi:hypothetical protein